MITRKIKLALLTAAVIIFGVLTSSFTAAAAEYGVCTATSLNVRSGAGTSYPSVGYLAYGDTVTVEKTLKASDGGSWYMVTFTKNGTEKSGYVSSKYIDVKNTPSQDNQTANVTDKSFEKYLDSQGFPESYRPALRELHRKYPKWVFTSQQLDITFESALKEEMVLGRSLVHASALASWKSMEKGAYDFANGKWYGLDGSWVAASEQIVRYYLDPRNFLDDTYVFMFENLSYNKDIHNIEGVRNILADTFMNGNFTCPDTKEVYDYAETFMEAAERSGVSPYHMASRCRSEQGVNGAPQSLGTVKGYENYFNFFDVQAYATSTMTAAEMGCRYAKTTNPTYLLPWTNQYKAIVGGAIFVGTGYITKGQDTIYLQKFDVSDDGNGLYFHQYMTCIFGAANEAAGMKKAYSEAVLNSALEFKIPVYKDMPATPASKPVSSGDNNDLLRSLSVEGQKLSPSFDKYTTSYTVTVPSNVSSVSVKATALGGAAKVSGSGKVVLKEGTNTVKVTVTAASGSKRTYTINITRKKGAALKKGDVNGDGTVTVVDALEILSYSAGKSKLSSAQITAADIDKSGSADVVDALTILQYVSGKRKSL